MGYLLPWNTGSLGTGAKPQRPGTQSPKITEICDIIDTVNEVLWKLGVSGNLRHSPETHYRGEEISCVFY
jgi:hypothetical protein